MEPPASLAVVEDAVRREFDAQERRADAADTRAGLVLGFAGLVASVVPEHLGLPLALAVRLLAAAAALAALLALGTFVGSELDALLLRRRYLTEDPVRTRVMLLDTDASAAAYVAARLTRKLARLRLASALVIAAVALGTLGTTVEFVARRGR